MDFQARQQQASAILGQAGSSLPGRESLGGR
jgi:hypothetical protein